MFEWVKLTPKDMAKAYEIGHDVIKKKMKNNHTGNNELSKYAGYVGQLASMKYLNAKNIDDFEYDLNWKGQRIEVKTKVRNCLPQPNYKCCVYASNADQLCDVYVFCQAMRNPQNKNKLMHGAYLLGWISRKDYNDRFYFMQSGEPDEYDDGYKSNADCYKINICDLNAMNILNEA